MFDFGLEEEGELAIGGVKRVLAFKLAVVHDLSVVIHLEWDVNRCGGHNSALINIEVLYHDLVAKSDMEDSSVPHGDMGL